ncbi:hypothetical protein GCM10025793_02890 [Lysobacter lycopersici]
MAWTRLLFGFLIAVFAANALAYAATTAGWIAVSDNWYFIDRIVYPYAHGNLHPQDLLVKRGAMDHAQPLRRLLLLANYEWFDLDFRIEALFATVAGMASFCLLGIGIRRELRAGGRAAGFFLVAMAAVYFSLSAPMVFTWSLLTLGFTSHFFLFLWLLTAWAVLEVPSPGRAATLVVATFLFGLVADDTALVATIAVVLAAALFGWRDRTRRGAAFLQVAACIVGIGLYLAFYKVAAPVAVDADAAAAHGSRLGGLVSQAGHAWQWILVPLSSSLVHRATLHAWFGDAAGVATVALGLACILAHLWFWKKALDGEINRTAFIAVSIMFLFYGLVAGILLGRVSEFGAEYLWQPRYGFIYRWHLLALLMMLVAQWPAMARAGQAARRARGVGVALAVLVVALQLPLGITAWKDARYTRHANAETARQLLEMGGDAAMQAPGKCAAQLVVCKFNDARRQRIIGFLERQHLNAFSPEVRARNGYPGD